MKGNPVPKGVVSLERLLDLQTKFQTFMNDKSNRPTMIYELVNMGID